MLLRPYLAQDRLLCTELFHGNCPKFFDSSEFAGFESWLNGQDKGQPAHPNSAGDHYYVLTIEDRVIACGGFYLIKDQSTANMAWGMVHYDFHRQGIGRRLTEHRINQVLQLYPNHSIILDTSQHTFPFYERLGFSVTKITKDAYALGLDRYDMVRKG